VWRRGHERGVRGAGARAPVRVLGVPRGDGGIVDRHLHQGRLAGRGRPREVVLGELVRQDAIPAVPRAPVSQNPMRSRGSPIAQLLQRAELLKLGGGGRLVRRRREPQLVA